MSLSSSLNTAVSGLDLSSRRAEVVSQNVANADRPGYASRRIGVGDPNSRGPRDAVMIERGVDPRLVQSRREAQASLAGQTVNTAFFLGLDAALGDPGEGGSPQDRIATFEAALLSAAAQPNSLVRLTDVVDAAEGLAGKFNAIDADITRMRQQADSDIGHAVTQLNADLQTVARLNGQIARSRMGGADAADLLDQRSLLIDRISTQIPVRELPRDNGAVSLVSTGGQLLLEGKAGTFSFSPRNPLTAAMSHPTHLSGLEFNGRPIVHQGPTSLITGGQLQALFDLRDVSAPEATANLDSLAANLIDRFADPALDASRPSGGAGLFTDRGAALTVPAIPGLAGRLAVNPVVQPSAGGDVRRLRDGLGAMPSSDGSDPALLLDYGRAMATRTQLVFSIGPSSEAFADHAAILKSDISGNRIRGEDAVSLFRTQSDRLVAQRDGGAVDIDSEMRRLIEIEQAYAANARVIQAVSDMMNRLTEI